VMRTTRLSLVISDVRLPDGDGLDIVRAARSSTPTPVVVVTGFPSEPGRRSALAAGASAYLAKPFSTADFSALIRDVVRRSASATDEGDGGRMTPQ